MSMQGRYSPAKTNKANGPFKARLPAVDILIKNTEAQRTLDHLCPRDAHEVEMVKKIRERE
jgi:hypothetical protein